MTLWISRCPPSNEGGWGDACSERAWDDRHNGTHSRRFIVPEIQLSA